MVTELPISEIDPWHDLLTTRYVCEICLTRYFKSYRCCPACHRFGRIRVVNGLWGVGPEVQDVVAAPGQTTDELVFHLEAGVVGGEGESHAR